MTEFQSLVERKLTPVGISGDDTIYACPCCEDESTGHHLYVDYNKGVYHCFKCGFRGRRIESLLKFLHVDLKYDYTKLYNEQSKELDDIIAPRKIVKKEKILDYSTDLRILTEYYNIHTKPIGELAYQYLRNRGISGMQIERLQIREGVNHYGEVLNVKGVQLLGRDYSGRIMVPSLRRDGLVSFYVGRDFIGGREPRYLNPPKEIGVASEDVWSLDTIETNSVVICEGVMTSIAVDQALGKHISCATYGKSIAQSSSNDNIRVTSQGEKLLSRKFDQYIVFYDKDAKKEAYSTAKYLYDRGAIVRVVSIPDDMYGPKADAADMTKEEIIDCIENAALFDIFTGIV